MVHPETPHSVVATDSAKSNLSHGESSDCRGTLMSDQDLSAVESVAFEWSLLLETALDRIGHCVRQLNHEQIWWRPAEGMNSVGILLRHLRGNLKQWVVEGVRDNRNGWTEGDGHGSLQREP